MYNYTLKKLPKKTVEILIDIPKNTVSAEYKNAFLSLLKNFEIKGFRKGKVPEAVAAKQIPKDTVYQELVRGFVPKIYQEIVGKENLKPVISPKIDLVKAKENEDWQIKISLAERPEVILGGYKEAINKIKQNQKKSEIWIPGKEPDGKQETEKEKSEKRQALLNQILSEILKTVKCEVSDLIIEEELTQRLSNLLTDIQKIGLTVEAYLKSKNITQEELKKRYTDEITQTYQLEFILAEIADKEKIKVEDTDLAKLFLSISDLKERESAKANSYFYASVLRKQKTLDYLLGV